jgi:Domain of unknown function (DUF6468)
VNNGFGVIVEMLVAILLALTIIYCVSLNRRLKLLKADEQSLRAVISELVTATEIAERAIAGLKVTVQECEAGLGERLRSADRFTADLDRSVAAGQELLHRLTRIVVAGNAAASGARLKPAAAVKPAPAVTKLAPAAKSVPATKSVAANKPAPVTKSVSAGKPAARPAAESPRGAQAVAAAAQAFAERLRVKVHGIAA